MRRRICFRARYVCVALLGTVCSVLGCDAGLITRTPGPASDEMSALFIEADRSTDCVRSSARVATSDTIIISDARRPRCSLIFRESGIVLRSDSLQGYGVIDPGPMVARSADGKFYTSVAQSGSLVAVWGLDGALEGLLAGVGDGPGELPLAGSAPLIAIDASSNIHVRGSGGRWSVFAPSGDFIRRLSVPRSAPSAAVSVVMGSKLVLSAAADGDARTHFTVTDLDTGSHRSFGAVAEAVRTRGLMTLQRAVRPVNDTLFWAGPLHGGGSGYVLDLWSVNGRYIRSIKRNAVWYHDVLAPRDAGHESLPSRQRSPMEVPPPWLQPVHIDPSGLLIVVAWVPNTDWLTTPGNASQNVYIEVIDPGTGELAASQVVRGEPTGQNRFPRHFLPGTQLAYSWSELPTGVTEVRILEYVLIER